MKPPLPTAPDRAASIASAKAALSLEHDLRSAGVKRLGRSTGRPPRQAVPASDERDMRKQITVGTAGVLP